MKNTAVITGSSGGIGTALCEAYNAAGYNVIGLDIKNNPDVKLSHFISCDLNDYANNEAYRESINQQILNQSTKISVLINNAATQILGSLSEVTHLDWQKTISINLSAPFFLSQSLFPILKSNNGCIINIGSIHNILTKPAFISYATSKSALIGLTKSLSVDIGKDVRVNSISPAAIRTQMLLDGFDNDIAKVNQLANLHPSRTIGQPSEIAILALSISNNDLKFLNGSNISIDGGISNTLNDL
jgi:NAD(P)-dependent dehydrogenase (short-subunit alcohol dehydrogenase family)